jgi:ribosomal-protein-alanine N-acetyltransferase
MDPLQVHIRWMITRDLEEVLDIEGNSFEWPWRRMDFVRCLRERNVIGQVAEWDEKVVGFNVYEMHKVRFHILNLAVAPEFRLRGVGRQLVEYLRKKLCLLRRVRINLEVRETNIGAQLFFRQQGFRAVHILRDYYEDTDDDAYQMEYRLPSKHPANLATRRGQWSA